MIESLPRYQNLCRGYSQHVDEYVGIDICSTTVTHASNLLQVTVNVSPQHIDRNLLPLILMLPHIPKPATVQRDSRWTVGQLNLQRPRE